MLLAFCMAVGCAPTRNPLEGWKGWGADTGYHLDKAITDDYQSYIKTLPTRESAIAEAKFSQMFFEDGTGQHAVEISIPLDGTWWKYVLIYDKNNKRTKVIKYASGKYAS